MACRRQVVKGVFPQPASELPGSRYTDIPILTNAAAVTAMQHSLADYTDRLKHAVDAEEVWRLSLSHFGDRGAAWLYHGYTAPLWHHDRSVYFSYSSIPADWDRYREQQGYRHHDPAVRHCARSSAPFPFGTGLEGARYTAPVRKMYAESADWGAHCGVAFPLRNVPGSPVGAMVCITRMRAPEFQIWWNESRWELQIASLALDARLLQFHCPADVVPDLSARERECLLWLASGLRTDRIAHRMGISSSAVDLYLANARRKLGARTRDQALLKAVLLGMLTP
jgi:DNA-binding CsgD family transcriptional regulator